LKTGFIKILSVFLFVWIFAVAGFSQEVNNKVNPNGYNIFYYPNGQISSEGTMRNGKPDGYWKNYYENGILKSEGNRKNFLLDSTWRFHDENGRLTLEINYKNGKKNGYRITYSEDEITKENFVDDVKQGYSYILDTNGRVRMEIPFVDGLENGLAREFDENGYIIQLITYKKGYVVSRERINRYDSKHLPHGKWKWFYDDGTLKMEGTFSHGLKNGYFKEYDRNGNLISVVKYVNGEKEEKTEELTQLDIKTDYWPNGKPKIVATYKNGVPEGVRREYNENGEVEKSYIFKNGKIIAEGILTDGGKREGLWKEYYLDGSLKSEGNYKNDKKTGKWKYYYPNGQLEETGEYENGKPVGKWLWYYPSGKLLREMSYYEGKPDGAFTEYDEDGNVTLKGEYLEGKREGKWVYSVGDTREETMYSDDLKNGWDRIYSEDGTLLYEGKYIDDNPNGEHKWYWPNGKLKQVGRYMMGIKTGDWRKYTEDGQLYLTITYKRGKEEKYDGVNID
jgi:antitoxin component YwqK of YwqJK toxin-antitoxin module